MNLLAFDTSTDVLSIAASRMVGGQAQVWAHTGAGGAQASTGLIAGVLGVLQQAGLTLAELDAVCFGSGPGSFTGLRTACAVAQGLAFGAKVPVLPVESLLAVAEEARFTTLAQQADGTSSGTTSGVVQALLDARMDEMYAATYAFSGTQWSTLQTSHLVRPEDLQLADAVDSLAGNVFAVYGARLPPAALAGKPCVQAMPMASAMLRLAPQLLAQGRALPAAQALPIYIRDKVAKTTLERETEKALAHSVVVAQTR